MDAALIIKATALYGQWSEVRGKLEDESRRMYHNGSIREWPDIDDEDYDYFWEWFWEWLGDQARSWIDQTEDDIYEKWKERITIHTWGRGGATFAPDEFLTNKHARSYPGIESLFEQEFHSFDDTDKEREWFLSEIDDEKPYIEDAESYFEQDKERLEIVKFINDSVEEGVKCLPEAWEEEKAYRREAA